MSLKQEALQEIIELRQAGWTYAAIGNEIGRTRQAVQDIIKRHSNLMKEKSKARKKNIKE